MSDSSPSCENNTSDTGSQVSSTPSDLPAKRRCRSNSQIQGKAWVFQGEITTDMLSADTESVANTPDDDDDEEDDKAKFSRLKLRLTARLGDDFINFLGVKTIFTYFVIFCDLVRVLHNMPGPDPDPDLATPSEVKIRVRGFLQCPQTISITSLRKCLPDVTDFISGEWDRCVGGLKKSQLYNDCMRTSSSWMPLHHSGKFGDSTRTSSRKRMTLQVIFDSKFPRNCLN